MIGEDPDQKTPQLFKVLQRIVVPVVRVFTNRVSVRFHGQLRHYLPYGTDICNSELNSVIRSEVMDM